MRQPVDKAIQTLLDTELSNIEKILKADMVAYHGALVEGVDRIFRFVIEDLATDKEKKDKLVVVLTTNGGNIETVERIVNVIRHFYKTVDFIVPDYAYSAGTIFCMSGDDIYMDYYSVLGPIDPQVYNKDGRLVPALGYLDKVEDLIEKDRQGTLTNAEYMILKTMDLAELKSYEQAKALTVDLLKQWLVKYKFRNWSKHRTDEQKMGKPVTQEEKEARAEEIASSLSDNKKWKSHGRPIPLSALKELRLEIKDFSEEKEMHKSIRTYHDLLMDYIGKTNRLFFIHTRRFI
ncbi:MAG TPA: serine dehydrogenasease [Candidatus Cloacimonetes bacterium]|nr:serine dehydrogenasease [Candidatus Cloacimonadota bacterium]